MLRWSQLIDFSVLRHYNTNIPKTAGVQVSPAEVATRIVILWHSSECLFCYNDYMNTAVSANKQKKVVLVNDATEKVKKSTGMVFTNYQGLTHQQLEGFKKAIKPMQAEYVVIKNTLMLRSLAEHTLSESDRQQFQQPTGTLFMYADPVEPLKALSKMVKELKLPSIKFGIIDGRVVSEEQVSKIATLPPINVLRAQLLGQMQAPISGLHRALNWNLQQLVLTLNAVKDKKTN